jgi:hypothetical protein
MVKATIVTSQSGDIDAFNATVGTLQNTAVYVGIPEAGTGRKRDTIGPHQKAYVTNAGLLYIHTNGSQLRHIPARPVIEPAIEANRLRIESLLHQAATLALDGKKREANHKVKMCGQFASNAAKAWFTDPRNGWAQNAPDTIRRKLSKLKRKGVKANKKWLNARTLVNLVPQYMPLYGTTALDSINTPLIDTAQLRRAITYVTKF